MERIMEAVISPYSQMMSATGQTWLQMYKQPPQFKLPDPDYLIMDMNCVLITYWFWIMSACTTFWVPSEFRPLWSSSLIIPPNQSQQLQSAQPGHARFAPVYSGIIILPLFSFRSTVQSLHSACQGLIEQMADGGQRRKEQGPAVLGLSCLLCLPGVMKEHALVQGGARTCRKRPLCRAVSRNGQMRERMVVWWREQGREGREDIKVDKATFTHDITKQKSSQNTCTPEIFFFFCLQHVRNVLAMLHVMYTLTGWLISWQAWHKFPDLVLKCYLI